MLPQKLLVFCLILSTICNQGFLRKIKAKPRSPDELGRIRNISRSSSRPLCACYVPEPEPNQRLRWHKRTKHHQQQQRQQHTVLLVAPPGSKRIVCMPLDSLLLGARAPLSRRRDRDPATCVVAAEKFASVTQFTVVSTQ